MLTDFVEKTLFSTLQEIEWKQLKDEILNVYEIALIYHYSESGYENINEILIKNNGAVTTEYAQYLTQILLQLPDYQQVVFRGTTLNKTQKQKYLAAFEQNLIVQEPFFLSASKSESIADSFSKGDTLFTIFSKTGKQIVKFCKFGLNSGQNEKEVLFLPNTNFEVLAVTKHNSKTLIILEEI